MTQIWTGVIATFQQTSTSPGANVFGFNALVDSSSHSQRLELAFCCLPVNRFPLPCTAPLTAFVSTTVHGCFASSQTLWGFNITCVAHRIKCVTTTPAGDLNCKKTGQTFPGVTNPKAQMTAVESLFTLLVAVGNALLAACPCRSPKDIQASLTARTSCDHVRRSRAVWCLFNSWMARLLTLMLATVHCSPAYLSAIKCANPRITVLLLASLAALDIFCHFPTIAGRLHLLSACATEPLMARLRTSMFATRHDITTDLTTAPACFVAGLRTLLRARLLPTEATLQSAHM